MKDELFKTALVSPGSFQFDEAVAQVFDDMIRRSVPGYESIILLSGLLANRFVKPNTHCYDLGCSLGAGLLAMQQRTATKAVFIGVDNSAPMINKCRQSIAALPPEQRQLFQLRQEDISDTSISNASLVALNFTLQFIQSRQRGDLLKKIYLGLNPGGALILSEKIAVDSELLPSLYEAFKCAQGYDQIEISNKRTALEKVLIPDSLDSHQKQLRQAGFNQPAVWFQCFNFCSILAVK